MTKENNARLPTGPNRDSGGDTAVVLRSDQDLESVSRTNQRFHRSTLAELEELVPTVSFYVWTATHKEIRAGNVEAFCSRVVLLKEHHSYATLGELAAIFATARRGGMATKVQRIIE